MSAFKGNPHPQRQKVTQLGVEGPCVPLTRGRRGQSGPLAPCPVARDPQNCVLGPEAMIVTLGHSLQASATTPSFGLDPDWLFPQNPINTNDSSTLGNLPFLQQLHRAPELCAQLQSSRYHFPS